MLAGTAAGVFRSWNSGRDWTAVNTAQTLLGVRAFAASGSSVFVGTIGAGVLETEDDGTTWKPLGTGLTSATVRALDVSGRKLFAATDAGVWIYAF